MKGLTYIPVEFEIHLSMLMMLQLCARNEHERHEIGGSGVVDKVQRT